jgi:hypothetical protein
MSITKTCKVKNCSYKSRTFRRGLCASHYVQFLSSNKVISNKDRLRPRPAIIDGDVAKIPLGVNAKDGYAIVDKEFAYLADKYKWSKCNYGYALTGASKDRVKLHHLIIGKPPGKMVTDHINQIKLDNRRRNLRHVTRCINEVNKPLNSNNKSGYKNVYWNKKAKKWAVQVRRDGTTKFIGEYKTIIEAVRARDRFLIRVI